MERAVPLYYSIKEIQTILNCSYTKAQCIAHAMIMAGDGFKDGGLLRVRIDAFNRKYGIDKSA